MKSRSVQAYYTHLFRVALMGLSATCFIACGNKRTAEPPDPETLITMQSTNHVLINSANGKISYHAETPLMERYEQASEPYMEFRKGIHATTFNDSTGLMASDIVADYAKFIEPQELWEARGNVVATTSDGKVLETEQLFWDQKIDKIYSNVDSKMTDGDDVVIGVAFESDSAMENYRIYEPRGQVTVDAEPRSDTTALDSPPVLTPAPETGALPEIAPALEGSPADAAAPADPQNSPVGEKATEDSDGQPEASARPETESTEEDSRETPHAASEAVE